MRMAGTRHGAAAIAMALALAACGGRRWRRWRLRAAAGRGACSGAGTHGGARRAHRCLVQRGRPVRRAAHRHRPRHRRRLPRPAGLARGREALGARLDRRNLPLVRRGAGPLGGRRLRDADRLVRRAQDHGHHAFGPPQGSLSFHLRHGGVPRAVARRRGDRLRHGTRLPAQQRTARSARGLHRAGLARGGGRHRARRKGAGGRRHRRHQRHRHRQAQCRPGAGGGRRAAQLPASRGPTAARSTSP